MGSEARYLRPVTRRVLATSAAAGVAAWLVVGGATAVRPPVLGFSVDVPLPGVEPYEGGLCGIAMDGSRPERLAAPQPMRDAAWSPDGRRLAYLRMVGDEVHVFVAGPEVSRARNLTRGLGSLNADPAWSPDGLQIALTAWNAQGQSRIVVAERDGTRRRALTLPVNGNAAQPAWAPDGRQLAVIVSSDPPLARDLYVVDVDGRGSRLLATGASEPTWSPDGSRIAYVTAGTLTVATVNGSGNRTLVQRAAAPAWSPDGRLIAFVRGDDLLTVRPDGGGERVVVRGPLPVQEPSWQAAGNRARGTRQPCVLEGTGRSDVLRGTRRSDIIVAGGGADTIYAGGGDDVVLGGSGPDFVNGEGGQDRLVGGVGRDRLYGGRGDDTIFGRDSQADLLDGGAGNDAAHFDPGVVAATDRARLVERLLGGP
jgi:RTX calcium-binding nonapeptide repeat (4 copies)/WD40-like Beta Propeller Repeat